MNRQWFKPAKGPSQIYGKLDSGQPEHVPDCVAEAATAIPMAETRARADVDALEVQAKAAAGRHA